MSIYIEPKQKWEKTKEVDGLTHSKAVAEVENGFIIVERVYGNVGEGEDAKYKDESKAFISETNPLDEEDMTLGVKSLLGDF